MSKCHNCDLYKEAISPCVKGTGSKKTGIMIIGEAPGLREDEEGIPFIGSAGQFLTKVIEEAGLNREDCYITNAVKCRPPQNRTPTKTEIKACSENLMKEIKKYKPKYILTVGNIPLNALLGKSGIMKYRGQVYEVHGAKVYPTIHPAGVLRNPKYLPLFKGDISRFVQATKGIDEKGIEYKVKLIKTTEQLKKLKKLLKKKKTIAYDFETQNTNHRTAKIWMLGIATSSKRAYVIPLQHPESPFSKEWRKVLLYFKDIFEDRSKYLIAQNGKFDNKFFRREGIYPFQRFDTMLASHLLDENTPNDLEYLSMTLLGTRPYKKDYAMTFDPPSPLKKMAYYCGEDCCNTFGIYKKQKIELEDDPRLENIFYNLKMPASRLFEKIEETGIWLDRKKLKKNGRIILKNLNKLEKKLNKLIPDNFPYKVKVYKTEAGFKNAIRQGKYGDNPVWTRHGKEYHIRLPFNWGSTQQVAQLLYSPSNKGGWGLVPPDIKEAKTKTGNDATGEAVLVHLREQHPGIELLIEYKGWRQLYNNFIGSWEEQIDQETDRLYPTFKLHGTVTHRLSSSNPNPQQTPRNPLIRGCVGAPPGKVFVEFDYSQIELRIAAFISGCPVMTRAFQLDEDIHTKTAVMLSGLDPTKMDKEHFKEFRKKAKPVNFGFLYGMWWKTFKQYAFQNYGVKFTDSEAEEARNKYFDTYTGLIPWHKRQEKLAKKLGYVRYPCGTIRRLPDIYSTDKAVVKEAIKQAINSPVQGFASNICVLSAITLDKIIDWDECKMVLSMHDALMFEIDEDKADKWVQIIKSVMEDPPIKETFGIELNVPIKVDGHVGRYWVE